MTPARKREVPRPAPQAAIHSPESALAAILARIGALSGQETVPLAQAMGRVLATDIRSDCALPRFTSSAMDGYGLHADDLAGRGGGWLQVGRRVHAGAGVVGPALAAGTAVRLTTGAQVPDGVAAVAPDEHVALGEANIQLLCLPQPGANIRWAGEDVALGAVLAPAGRRVDGRLEILLAATGVQAVTVRRRPRVALLSTGNELVEPGAAVGADRIVDVNRLVLRNVLAACDAETIDLGIAGDRLDDLSARLGDIGGADLLVTTGGAANSEADLVAEAVIAAGGRMWGLTLALKPGRRIGYGRLGRTHVLCLPGNPLAALVTGLLFAQPVVEALGGRTHRLAAIAAQTGGRFRHRTGRVEFIPARIAGVSGEGLPLVQAAGSGDSHRLMPLSLADGLVRLPSEAGDVGPGRAVSFLPFSAAAPALVLA